MITSNQAQILANKFLKLISLNCKASLDLVLIMHFKCIRFTYRWCSHVFSKLLDKGQNSTKVTSFLSLSTIQKWYFFKTGNWNGIQCFNVAYTIIYLITKAIVRGPSKSGIYGTENECLRIMLKPTS